MSLMKALSKAKFLLIATGLYRPARWLNRRIRPHLLRASRKEVEFYSSLVSEGALCFDVGSNIGDKSEALLEVGARVVAFEPNLLVVPELQARCGHHKNWTLVAAAIGGAPAVATLHARESHGSSGLSADWPGKVVTTYHVPVLTLDSAIKHFGPPVYCKIDVEGWELEVLEGLTKSIPLISFEFHLNERDIQKTKSCLKKLICFGPAYANITPAENAVFHFKEWIRVEDFLAWFPGDLRNTLPGYHYGDIFIRRDEANRT